MTTKPPITMIVLQRMKSLRFKQMPLSEVLGVRRESLEHPDRRGSLTARAGLWASKLMPARSSDAGPAGSATRQRDGIRIDRTEILYVALLAMIGPVAGLHNKPKRRDQDAQT
jgi:hypothetical protein